VLDFTSNEFTTDVSWFQPANRHSAACWISFGGNVGDVKATFDAALALLSLHSHIQLGPRSGLYRTSPMGVQAGNCYLNSVCQLATTLGPQELLKVLQTVENQLGRIRDLRWGPRTLDLDLLSYGDQVVDQSNLTIPHPALTYRRFVLNPLAEVDPCWRHPVCDLSARRLLERLKKRPLRISILGATAEQIEDLARKAADRYPEASFVVNPSPSDECLVIQTTGTTSGDCRIVDLRRSPGDMCEQLGSALTAIFDEPERIGDW
jgi:2-amino-4-hydroxy-6-hydroxymethyldihydropteridine diphosphokinase